MTSTSHVRWDEDGWRGWRTPEPALDVAACLAADASGRGRRSRHARSQRIETAHGAVFVKSYPAPGARRARRAFAMGCALEAAGFAAPRTLLVGWREGAGLLVTAEAGGEDLLGAVQRLGGSNRSAKRSLLARLGAEVARLHQAGFVHGDLVPPNLRWRDGAPVYLDNDRTRRSGLGMLARRNLVQLGRFVVPGVSATDRARVLLAYATARGLDRRRRHRLGGWVIRKITARRCAIDGIAPEVAARAGFRTLMRSGGPFDPEVRGRVMRTALVTLAHPQHAGMLRALRVLDDAAPRHGWTLRYAFPARHPLLDEIGIPAERTAIVPGLARWRRLAGALVLPDVLRLARLARGADVLYSTTLSTFPLCHLAGQAARVPQVVHVYSSYGEARPYRKHWLRRARHVIAPSADSLSRAREAVGGFRSSTRARVVYNGMDIPRIEQQAAAPLPAGWSDRPGALVGMVGNLDWRKNPAVLVEAAPAIRATIPDVRIALVGAFPDSESEARVRARIGALGLRDAVIVTGFLANPFPLVRRLEVLVHPALRDPFPLALLEGMALGRPIVASAVGGIPEMLIDGESGILVPPDDAAALAAAVVGLLRDAPHRRAVGAAAFTRLRTHFTLDGFARAMFDAFDQAVADGVS